MLHQKMNTLRRNRKSRSAAILAAARNWSRRGSHIPSPRTQFECCGQNGRAPTPSQGSLRRKKIWHGCNTVAETFIGLVLLIGLAWIAMAQQSKPLYENNFEKAELNKAPDDFLVLDGQYAVKEEGGNKF